MICKVSVVVGVYTYCVYLCISFSIRIRVYIIVPHTALHRNYEVATRMRKLKS